MNDIRHPVTCLVNGDLIDAEQASISIHDRGFLYGDGLFETIPVYDGNPFALVEHLARLHDGMAALRMRHAPTSDLLARWIADVIAANGRRSGIIRVAVSRGRNGSYGLGCANVGTPTTLVTWALPRLYPRDSYTQGVVLHVSNVRHPSPDMLPTRFKHANYLASILAYDEAVDARANEALLLNAHGRVCEGAFSNVFFVRGGTLLTPHLDEGPLAGVTRRIVLGLAVELGVPAEEGRIDADLARRCDECFITNSNAGLLPVRAIGDATLAAPGPLTSALSEHYWQRVRAQAGTPWFDT